MPYLDRRGVTNEIVYPVHNKNILWRRNGLSGYAYANSSQILTHVSHVGEVCSIELPKHFDYENLMNQFSTLMLSNDGRFVAVAHKETGGRGVDIYEGCKKIAHQTLPADNRIIGLCVSRGDYWFVFEDEITNDVFARNGNSKAIFTLPGNVSRKNKRAIPHWPPIFDYEKKKFLWLSAPEQKSGYAAVDLFQYDPLTKQESVLQLILGTNL